MIEGLLDLASAFGLSTSAGLNAYIPMLTLALLAKFTNLITLGEPWNALTNWWIIAVLVVLLVIEELADKIPAVDTINDIVQTLVRPTAGAILFASTTQQSIHMHPILAFGCGIILAGSVHVIKAGARPVVTAMTAGTGNPIVSTIEDIISAVTSIVAIIFPYLVVVWFLLLVTLVIFIVRWRKLRSEARETRTAL
ncbi:MAG: DUF4126 domain-containing protein [Anaerolineae bacterium]|nr:DUF4126 domain-containing protein [Anaerolineae bacterium]